MIPSIYLGASYLLVSCLDMGYDIGLDGVFYVGTYVLISFRNS